MLGCSACILFYWARRKTAVSQSEEAFFAPGELGKVGVVAIASFVTIALFEGIGPLQGIGVYGALPLLLFFYLKDRGDHRWMLTIVNVIAIPVVTFLFFQIALKNHVA